MYIMLVKLCYRYIRHDFACYAMYSPRVLPYEDRLQLLKQLTLNFFLYS